MSEAAEPQAVIFGSVVTGDSPASRLIALILCILVGFLGIHRFYVGKWGTGVLMLLTGGLLGIWVIIDIILIVVGAFRDKQGLPVLRWS
jgi:TM2 domain-containing membrane protein YozV